MANQNINSGVENDQVNQQHNHL
uniref:Uncharacterized protein n=1 Tax=Tetranychus urticae TaxID=32264 RepID=T1JUH6_TETUR